jgi:hypothetical protein
MQEMPEKLQAIRHPKWNSRPRCGSASRNFAFAVHCLPNSIAVSPPLRPTRTYIMMEFDIILFYFSDSQVYEIPGSDEVRVRDSAQIQLFCHETYEKHKKEHSQGIIKDSLTQRIHRKWISLCFVHVHYTYSLHVLCVFYHQASGLARCKPREYGKKV